MKNFLLGVVCTLAVLVIGPLAYLLLGLAEVRGDLPPSGMETTFGSAGVLGGETWDSAVRDVRQWEVGFGRKTVEGSGVYQAHKVTAAEREYGVGGKEG